MKKSALFLERNLLGAQSFRSARFRQLKNCIEVNVGYITVDVAFVNLPPDVDNLIQFAKKLFLQKFSF